MLTPRRFSSSQVASVITLRRPARRRYVAATVDPPTLFQFVALSMLVHVLVILLFGNVQSVGGRESESWWGPLNVTLRRLTPEIGSGIRLAPGADRGEDNRSLLRRPEVRRETPREQAPTRAEPTPEPSASVEALPRLNLEAPEQADREVIQQPAPIERIVPRRLEREPVPPVQLPPREVPIIPSIPIERIEPPKIERQVAPTVELRPREVPIAPSTPIERIEPPKIERQMTPAVELPPREVPVVPAAPIERIAPARVEQEVAPPVELPPREVFAPPSAPIERLAPSKIQQEVAPPVELPPREVFAPPTAPIERLAPSTIQQEVAPAVALPPREVLAPPAAPIEPLAPSTIRQEVAPAVELPPREVLTAPSASIDRITPKNIERELSSPPPVIAPIAPRAAPAAPAPLAPATTPVPEQREAPTEDSLPRLRFGAPQPDESMFQPRPQVVTPSSEPGGLPHIDREASRERAREIASGRSGSRGVFNPIPIPPEAKTKEAVAIEKAARPDCRDAYAGLGLLAVPVLVASAIADAGCKW